MGRPLTDPAPETASELRRLRARRERQEQALEETRAEVARVIVRAVKREGSSPAAVARLAGLSRTQTYTTLTKKEGQA